MYKLAKDVITGNVVCVTKTGTDGYYMAIPIAPANTDYANFKKQINADQAQLQDADGNLMTAEQAKHFISTLP